ncbi:MAG: universal stress protein [Gammaproteobacteria bacterium]|nr:universal stress protein [Gammaproteobacteria bacterium]
MFKTILVPIDVAHSDSSQDIIDMAMNNGAADTKIILLNVVEEIPKWAAVQLPADIQSKSLKDSQDAIDAIASKAKADTEVIIRVGHPYQTILAEAKKNSIDLIVIASHKPGLQDYLLGSTAAKVVRHATCSVLVVR